MTEAGTLCNNSNVVYMAGANADATYTAEAYTNVYIKMVEGDIFFKSGYDWVTNYANVKTIGKEFLRYLCAAGAAILAIQANTNNYLSLNAAQTDIAVLDSIYSTGIASLKKEGDKQSLLLS